MLVSPVHNIRHNTSNNASVCPTYPVLPRRPTRGSYCDTVSWFGHESATPTWPSPTHSATSVVGRETKMSRMLVRVRVRRLRVGARAACSSCCWCWSPCMNVHTRLAGSPAEFPQRLTASETHQQISLPYTDVFPIGIDVTGGFCNANCIHRHCCPRSCAP